MSGIQNGPNLLGPDGLSLHRKATDEDGRKFAHNATVEDVYAIVLKETAKVHEHYLNQIPQYMGQMIHDALMSFGLVKVVAGEGGVPTVVGHQDHREPMTDEQVLAFRELLQQAKQGPEAAP